MIQTFNIKPHFSLKTLTLLALLLSLAGCFEPPPYNNLDNDQLKAMLQQGTPIVDVRRPDEWRKTGVIKNSQLLTFVDGRGQVKPDFLQRFSAAFGKDDPVILICRTGNRTDSLARHLVKQMGYTQIYNVRNGITSWIRAGGSVSAAQ